MTNTLTTFQTINNTPMMSSRQLAEVLGSTHREVLRGIRNMAEELEIDVCSTAPTSISMVEDVYIDSWNREQEMFWLNEELTMTYASGYSLKLRNLIVKEWINYRDAFKLIEEAENMEEVRAVTLATRLKLRSNHKKFTQTVQDNRETLKLAKGHEHSALLTLACKIVTGIIPKKFKELTGKNVRDYFVEEGLYEAMLRYDDVMSKIEIYSEFGLGYQDIKAKLEGIYPEPFFKL